MNKIIIIALALLFSFNAEAQRDRGDVEKVIEAKKIGYLTDKLELSPSEAEVFWPVYNSYSEKMKAFKREKFGKDEQEVSDKNPDQALNDLINNEKKRVAIMEEYVGQFKNVIGSEKTLRLFNAEGDFKREILKGMKKRRERSKKEEMKRKSKDK